VCRKLSFSSVGRPRELNYSRTKEAPRGREIWGQKNSVAAASPASKGETVYGHLKISTTQWGENCRTNQEYHQGSHPNAERKRRDDSKTINKKPTVQK